MLARVTIETTTTGVYCLHHPDAVAQLQGEGRRGLPFLGLTAVSDLAQGEFLHVTHHFGGQ